MKKKLHLVSLFYFNSNIAGKDMFLVPMYLGQLLGASVEFVYPKADFNKDFVGEYRDVKLTPIKSKSQYYSTFWSEKEMLWWLICNAHRIDVLSLFWCNKRNIIFANIYKLLNRKGICYIKGDFDETKFLESSISSKKKLKNYIKKKLYKAIDIISAETLTTYQYIKNGSYGNYLAERVEYVPNGFDIDLYNEFNMTCRDFSQKENLMITVGRVGTSQKNNEMLLAALDGIELKGWKFLFVGTVEDDFQIQYNDFIVRNPEKKDNILFLGLLNNRRQLWEIYNKAKVFILTSKWEGFPNVYSEALFWGNYILTTPVSSAMDVTAMGKLGTIIPHEGVRELQETLLNIINDSLDLDMYYSDIKRHSNKFIWSEILQPIANRIKCLCVK